jgi:hypothetical protein
MSTSILKIDCIGALVAAVARGAYWTGQLISTGSFGLALDYPHE